MTAIYSAAIFFIGLDRFLKVFAFTNQVNEVNLLGEILKFSYKANYYIAFSLPFYGYWLNLTIALIIACLIFFMVKKWRYGERAQASGLLAVILGASSNLFDRLRYGYVIDYLDLKYFTVFNLADVAITVGVILLLLNINKKQTA